MKILGRIANADGIAFLLDEFEDITLPRRLSKSQASAYTGTLRRLLNMAQREDLWIILSTTPEGLARTRELDPSLVDRFGHPYSIPPLTRDEAYGIVIQRLEPARTGSEEGLHPFAEDALDGLQETSFSSPRRLIKIMWHTVGLAVQRREGAPLTARLVKEAEKQLYAETPEP